MSHRRPKGIISKGVNLVALLAGITTTTLDTYDTKGGSPVCTYVCEVATALYANLTFTCIVLLTMPRYIRTYICAKSPVFKCSGIDSRHVRSIISAGFCWIIKVHFWAYIATHN